MDAELAGVGNRKPETFLGPSTADSDYPLLDPMPIHRGFLQEVLLQEAPEFLSESMIRKRIYIAAMINRVQYIKVRLIGEFTAFADRIQCLKGFRT